MWPERGGKGIAIIVQGASRTVHREIAIGLGSTQHKNSLRPRPEGGHPFHLLQTMGPVGPPPGLGSVATLGRESAGAMFTWHLVFIFSRPFRGVLHAIRWVLN